MGIELPKMNKEELTSSAFQAAVAASNANVYLDELTAATDEKLLKLFTTAQFVSDVCLNECERRGLIEMSDGSPVIPYCSDHAVETILTRG